MNISEPSIVSSRRDAQPSATGANRTALCHQRGDRRSWLERTTIPALFGFALSIRIPPVAQTPGLSVARSFTTQRQPGWWFPALRLSFTRSGIFCSQFSFGSL